MGMTAIIISIISALIASASVYIAYKQNKYALKVARLQHLVNTRDKLEMININFRTQNFNVPNKDIINALANQYTQHTISKLSHLSSFSHYFLDKFNNDLKQLIERSNQAIIDAKQHAPTEANAKELFFELDKCYRNVREKVLPEKLQELQRKIKNLTNELKTD